MNKHVKFAIGEDLTINNESPNNDKNNRTSETPPSSVLYKSASSPKMLNGNGHVHHHSHHESLLETMQKRIANHQRWFSLEFFPPKTVNGAHNLITKLENLACGKPLFCDITWHPAGDPGSDKPTSSLKIAEAMKNYCFLETMLHITCYGQTKESMRKYLEKAKKIGIRNILALRGDPPFGTEWNYEENEFNYASDLVRFIRSEYGDYFVICVAGYPRGHPDSTSYEDDLLRLKEKVDAGADFIITQLFFRPQRLLAFLADCRRLGIECPIIPGILPIQSYDSLRHICKLSRLEVPSDVVQDLERIKDNDEAIRAYGIGKAVELCDELFKSGQVYGVHFYTLNREVAVTEILKRLGLWNVDPMSRTTPWLLTRQSSTSLIEKRGCDEVRPIFWSTRPKSYVCRTSDWDQFPNGRWGNSSAASFGDLKDYHVFYQAQRFADAKQCRVQWGHALAAESDVWNVFECFISGRPNPSTGEPIVLFPWSEDGLASETNLVKDELVRINRLGILTINSQPNVNGVPSSDPMLGWGAPDGYVYQKAYLEFFISKDYLKYLLEALKAYPLVNYHILDKTGEINLTNCTSQLPNAVTWGVFPGKEIAQPTVVDPISFLAWKDEAFNLWTELWGKLYEPGSKSREVIETISNTYLLTNLVDNDFPKENCLFKLIDHMIKLKSADENI